MTKLSMLVAVLSIAFNSVQGITKLPVYLKPCARSDPHFNECAKKHGTEAIPYLIKGDSKYRIPNLNPLTFSQINLEASDNIKLYATNVQLFGLKDVEIVDFDWNFETKSVNVKIFCPILTIIGQYNMEGHILIMNLRGAGPMNNTHFGNEIHITINYDTKPVNNVTYANITGIRCKMNVKNTHFLFEKLLNNNEISKQMNLFLNENWNILMEDIVPSINLVIEKFIDSLLTPLAEKIPYNEAFLD